AASKGTTTTDKPATSKTKTFVKKSKDVIVKAVSDYYKEKQKIGFQPWGNLGNNKPKESGNAGEVGSGGKTSSNAGNKSSDGAGTSSSSSGKKTDQTPSSSKKSPSSGETDATASSPGTGKKSGDGEETGPSSSGKIEETTPDTSKKTQTSGEPDTTGSNTGTGKKSSEGEGTNSSSTNKKDNQIPNSHNQWKQDSSKKKGKDKDDKKKKEEEKRKREEEERQKSESEAEGTGDVPKVSHGKVFPTRVIDLETEGFIIDKVKVLRSKLSNRIKGDLNFAYAKVEIEGIDKNEFYSHSSLNGDNKEKTYADYSLKPTKPKYEATEAPDRSGNVRLRDNDTEYKILNDLASRLDKLPDPSKARGKIKLFTELDTYGSCSRIIGKFHKDYPNIDIEVIHNGDKIVEP
ncbi:deaminase domain-containing protein, partial [Paenibacillus sp. OK076]|uniref:deaminase domain-containing protein n=1 Tax=Paenibacillus sp. OK076 TaxID=1884379 RepID=UPI0008AE6ECA